MKDLMLKRFFTGYELFLLLGFFSLVFMGCDTMTEKGVVNRQSLAIEEGVFYTFHNRSSYTVTVYDLTGQDTIAPRGSKRFQFNKHATIYDVRYEPSERVIVEQFGSSFTFTDR